MDVDLAPGIVGIGERRRRALDDVIHAWLTTPLRKV
jgi:hypothetical protein